MAHYGVDVASMQFPSGRITDVDFPTVFAHLSGLGNGAQPFLIAKITEGTDYVFGLAGAVIQAAIATGFAVAAYEFNHPGTDAGAQWSFAKAHDPVGIPVEEDEETTDGTSWAQVHTEGQAFADDAGPTDLYYSYPSFIDSEGGPPGGHGLWLADPNHPLGQPCRPCVIHQGQPGPMPGFPGDVDPDIFMGTEADFARYFACVTGAPADAEPAPTPLPPPAAPVYGAVYPEDDMQPVTVTVQIESGHGWCAAPAGQIVSAVCVELDPAEAGQYVHVPQLYGVTSDAKLVFGPPGDVPIGNGNYGFIVWVIPPAK